MENRPLALTLTLTLCFLATPSPAQPNILFIFSDDHACRAVSAYGGGLNETPNLDRLAREGALFRNSFCANSICAPSRANVLTGKHSHLNGLRTNQDRFDGAQDTFPKRLGAAGYQTALIGKWHLKVDPTGFDHWEVLPGQGFYYNPVMRTGSGRKRYTGYATDIITDQALAWLDKRDQKKPFLLMVQHKAPHRTWAPAARHLDLYADRQMPEPPTLFDDWSGRSATLAKNEMSIRDYFYWDYDLKVPGTDLPNPFGRALKSPEVRRMTAEQRATWDKAYGPRNAAFLEANLKGEDLVRWKYQRYIKDYLRCIKAVDENVGRLLDWLDEKELAENTLVVYASDQGFYLGEHGWYDKRWMFEESFRTPLLARWPGRIPAKTDVDALVQNIDYAPTFLEAAGVAVPDAIQGKSLLPLTGSAGAGSWRKELYYAYYEKGEHNVPRHDGIRTERHKLMYLPDSDEWQLFDLKIDPREMKSVHDDPAYSGVLGIMKKRLADLRTHVKAPAWKTKEATSGRSGRSRGEEKEPRNPGKEEEGLRIRHTRRTLEGWTVHVDRRLLEGTDADLGARGLELLQHKLWVVASILPKEPVAALRRVPIFVDLDHPLKNMQYHPSRGWLRNNGHDEAMTQAVHVPRVQRLLDLHATNHQPWVVLHELAHAYHDRELGFDEPRIRDAYLQAKKDGLYEKVLHVSGREVRHYALTDHKEFFAEMTEAYFATNDFYPFVRPELRQTDPETFALLKAVWGPVP